VSAVALSLLMILFTEQADRVKAMGVFLGDGVRLFGRPGARRVNLERISVAESGRLTDLRFAVVK
jgi:hypothetical protein